MDLPASRSPSRSRYRVCLAATAASYAVLHHLGSLPGGLGPGPRGTRWVDWLDLLVPYAVLLPAALTLAACRSPQVRWWLFAVGGIAYADGHGIHLAGNSVGNVVEGDPAHLWDETVGHLLWYSGVALVAACLASSMRGQPRSGSPGAVLLALAVGLTWGSNAAGGEGTAVPAVLVALCATWYGWRHREGLPVLVGIAGVAALALLGLVAVST